MQKGGPAYGEFAARSNFSFLDGASHPEELAVTATALGYRAFGLADRNSVAGVVRAHTAFKELTAEGHLIPRYHPGARLVFRDGTPDILAYPADRRGWARLCRLLTSGNRRAAKGACHLDLTDLLESTSGLGLIVMPPRSPPGQSEGLLRAPLSRLAEAMTDLPPRLGLPLFYDGCDQARVRLLGEIARTAALPLIAVGDVLYHTAARRPLHDVLTCIRLHETLESAGRRLMAHTGRHLESPGEVTRLYASHALHAGHADALAETLQLSDSLTFSLDELRYEYPEEIVEGFSSPFSALSHFAYEGARRRYPQGLPEKVRLALAHELSLVEALGYAPYFLTVYDIVRFARGRGILCQGRGSAANSAVCFCLGITEVDPDRSDLLFERFISADRREPPDIDVDFEHTRREEVIQYIYARYGRERAGLAATVISYRARSAIREIGRVLGFSTDTLDHLTSSIWGYGSGGVKGVDTARAGLDASSPPVRHALAFAHEIQGFPRHLSQHVGGFVITRGRLDELVPIQNAAMPERTVIEWDKDDLDAVGILKVDVLGLGMLTCLKHAFGFLRDRYGQELSIATLPAEDPAVYRMLQRADSIGLFQVESRAQMSMLPRLKPKTFYDLVIEVAIVRPGPIQGDMVPPYLRRRQGLEPVQFPSHELEAVLGKTLGVPLFQEQAMRIAIVAAGFTPSEADRLRRAMATFRKVGTIGTFQTKMIEGMVANGYQRTFAERCFKQIEGFGEYGFPESHAASFALLVYASAWIKCHYPDVFAAALLNAQPLGFYAPAQIVRDAREHGVDVRPPDINISDWNATLEPLSAAAVAGARLHARHREMAGEIHSSHAVRLGFREIKGLSETELAHVVAARGAGYDSIRDLWLRTGLPVGTLERLADADTFGSLGLGRRDALWAVKALGRTGDDDDLPLFALPASAPGARREPDAHLPPMPLGEEVVNDYRFLSLSLKAHPLDFLRRQLAGRGVVEHGTLANLAPGSRIAVAGLVLVRQRPGSARGVIFMTLEDETGVANVIVWPKVFEKFRPVVLAARLVIVRGRLQSEHGVIHIVAERIEDGSAMLSLIPGDGRRLDGLARADEVKRPGPGPRGSRRESREQNLRRIPPPSSQQPYPSAAPPLFVAADLDVPASASRHAAPKNAMPKGRNFH